MVATRQPVFEREAAIRGVHALTRAGRAYPPGSRRPVVFFQGGPGSGKSLLLQVLDDRVNQYIPYARVDFADSRYDEIPHTLTVLAERLTRYRPRYGRLRFPRLLIALLVAEQTLPGGDFEQSREALRQRLRQRRGARWPQRFLRELTGEPPEAGVTAGAMTLLFRLPLQAVAAGLALVFPTFPRRSQVWFGHRDRGRTDHALDTLIELNTWARELRVTGGIAGAGAPPGFDARLRAARDNVDKLLCEAFLADLRDSPRRVHALPTPLLLLDNVDAPAGRAFLGRLLDARPPLEPGARAEPLTVVATGRVAPPELADTPEAPLDESPPPANARELPAWLRYRLPDLARVDVQRLLSDAAVRGPADRRLARLVHEFTGGHPEAVGVLAAALAARRDGAESVAELLEEPVPDPAGGGAHDPTAARRTAEQRLLHRLLPDADGRLDVIARCAAGRNTAESLWLSQRSGLASVVWEEGVEPWDPSAGAGSAVLLRLLRRRLARAPEEWREAHASLHEHCAERGDLAGRLYHRLALGEVREVAVELAELLPRTPGAEWLALLDEVARAPLGSVEAQRQPPHALFHALTREATGPASLGEETTTRMTHLLAALRIVSDPLHGTARELLYTQVANALAALASHSPDGLVVLQESVREYRRQAQWWA
ncbi:hypothetical protein FH609_028705 [Streptomyces sp. 3MP-14]|uniref:Uncharacterized protein n=1 Tax=Streptomyces mimosae TaxID=2586635 RepID=A0A5N5ZW37_9ACTN|nr:MULTISPECIES: hypothetical protein [Streptomyces]KAB8159570.1 hypothetical protein FH607_028185 [Streptomyces mimosae]KAB8172848.1 hypothetical protein FH609_028705 [Streptomyces sp. 3MP-14]